MADSSDDPTRPGWWRASDGKLYPPELHPRVASRTAPPPSPSPPQPPSVPAPPGPSGAGPPGTPWGGPPPQGAWSPYPSAPSGSGTPGLAIAALVLGAGALAFSFIPIFGLSSVPFALAGIGLGIAGIGRANKGDGGKGLSIAGIATGAGALLVSLLWFILFVLLAESDVNSDLPDGACDPDRVIEDPDC